MVEIDPVVAELIEIRKKKKLSQLEVANRMGTSQSAISEWESGNHSPRFISVRGYADAIEVTIYWSVEEFREEQASYLV